MEKGTFSGLAGEGDDEKKSLSDFINKERSERENTLNSRLQKTKDQKVGRFNLRGKLKKRARIAAISLLVTVFTAGPLALLAAVPHAIQSWIENRVSAYTQRASEKLGQRLLYEFIRNRVAISSCKGYYNSAESVCRPRMGERQGPIKQLFDDWHSANMEDALAKNNIHVEYDPNGFDGSGPGKPYRLAIAGEDFDFGDVLHSNWDDLEITDAAGRREFSKILGRETKAVLKKETKWWQFLKRRNLKAGYFRNLNLPRRFFGPDTLARKLDEREARIAARHTRWRQYLTKYVVKVGEGRVAGLIEILFEGGKLKDKKGSELVEYIEENNKVLRALMAKIGDEEIIKMIDKYAGKTGTEIAVKLIAELLEEILAEVGIDVALGATAEAASKFIPVVGQILLAFAILDLIDLATDGTLQRYLSVQNAQAMMDMSSLMDTTLSEEKRGYVDATSAGDLRLSLIKGLGSSRIFTNTIGYNSPDGKKAPGYDCKPNVTVSDIGSIFEAGQSIFTNQIGELESAGMDPNQDSCENHRVDYDPMNSVSSWFGLIRNGIGGFGGLDNYTKKCVASVILSGGLDSIGDILDGVIGSIPLVGDDCPTMQQIYHGVNGAIFWLAGAILGPLFNFLQNIPFVKSLLGNIIGWVANGVAIFITGYSLAGPELLQGGTRTDIPSGAKIFDAWSGGQQVAQNNFMRGVGDGGGLGGKPGTVAQTSKLNETIALERKEELHDSSFFARMFDITHADTLASGVMSLSLVEGGTENLINPFKNIATIFNSGNKTTFADSVQKNYCTDTNKKGYAVTEFGVVCNVYTDEAIDGLTSDQLEQYADTDYCENFTSGIEAKVKEYESEDYFTSTHQYPDGSGIPDQVNPCRLLCSVTDSAGTFARTNDPICGFENFNSSASSTTTGSGDPDNQPVAGDTYDTPCAEGSRDAQDGPAEGYKDGQKYSIRLCVMDIFQSSGEEDGGLARFNSTASPNVVAMVNAAGSGGLKASSSFRSMAKQTELYNCAPGCTGGNPAAKPGYSNHQMGFAFDFSNGSSSWSWMRGNAEKYGYKWLGTKDPVHWSTTGG